MNRITGPFPISPALKASPPQASTFEDLQIYTSDGIEHGVPLMWGALS